MKRTDLEHLIRAAGSIANTRELIIVGSQAILATYPEAPDELTVSKEADMYPADHPDKADLIDGSIGEGSPFFETFGYYAHGVGVETAILPKGWKSRLVRIQNANTNDISGLCLSPADIAASKLVAAREKDMEFVTALFRHKLLQPSELDRALEEFPVEILEATRPRYLRCLSAAQA
jgi:hypothetical protein